MTHRIGIVGIGSVADTHARGITEIAGTELVAASCRTQENGEAFAAEYDCAWYADNEELLDDGGVDVALVCTPSGAHLEPVVAAAERGIDVLCEKPLETTTARADELIAACEDAGVRLGGIFQNRYLPAFKAAHEAAATGQFGDLATVNAYVPEWRGDGYYENSWQAETDAGGGGALMNQTIHGIDAAQWLAGTILDIDDETSPVEEVAAYAATRGHEGLEVEDTAVLSLRYRDGSLGQVLASTAMYPGRGMRIQVGGRDGTAEIAEEKLTTWAFRDDEESPETADDRSEYGRNVEGFLDAVAADEPYELDGHEARKALAIVEAAYESAERGRPVAPN